MCVLVCVREVPCISKNVHCVAFSENQKQIMDNKEAGTHTKRDNKRAKTLLTCYRLNLARGSKDNIKL